MRIKTQWHTRFAEFEDGLARSAHPFFLGLAHGDMEVELFRPKGEDKQTPHPRDEIYIVRMGSGTFLRDEEVIEFGAGDVIFVPAGMEHRFTEFTDDFDTWVVFCGPEKG